MLGNPSRTPVGLARPLAARLAALACCALAVVGARADEPPAFPGAVGQGAASVGGRGGVVYHVTTLEDYAPHKGEEKIEGSFRHALRAEIGPRTIVFDVSGVIHLREPIQIQKDRVTVAGQTSPGGITLLGYPLEVSGAKDVVVRHLRVRCGDLHARPEGTTLGKSRPSNGDLEGSSANAVHIGNGAERVIFDHVSATWGIDETLSVTKARDVTVQNCLIAEALDESLHAKGAHGYGTLVRGALTAEDQRACRGGYTFYGNLWAHNRARNPSIAGAQSLEKGAPESQRRRTDVNLVNCVVYDWGDQATHRSQLGMVRLNLIGNYFVVGPSKAAEYFFRGGGNRPGYDSSPTEVYHRGNYFDADQNKRHDGRAVASREQVASGFRHLDDDDSLRSDGEPFCFYDQPLAEATQPAEVAYEKVCQGVGASLWRDAIDTRILRTLEQRSGRVIDSQESLRGDDGALAGVDDLPERRRNDGFDRDRDGIADAFELRHGLDPSDPSDADQTALAESLGLAGFTNLEAYLHTLTSPDAIPQPSAAQ